MGTTRGTYARLLAFLSVAVVAFGARAQDLSALTTALSDANTEVRTSIFPAVAAILAALVLIGAAGAVVAVITRGRG